MIDSEKWNNIVSLNGSNILHSWQWIEAKKSINQESILLFKDTDNLQCAIPVFIKKFMSIKFGWIPQGIKFVGDIYKLKEELNILKKKNSLIFFLTEDTNEYNNSKIQKLYMKFNKLIKYGVNETAVLNLYDRDEFISNYNKTTKKYVKKGNERFIVDTAINSDYQNLYNLYSQFIIMKKFKPPFDCKFYLNLMKICSLNENNKNSLKQITKKIIKNNKIINFVTALHFNENSIELLRFDNKNEENKYSSRLITHKILEDLKSKKVKIYDFGGIENKNPGIKKFKLSFGGKIVKTDGYKFIL